MTRRTRLAVGGLAPLTLALVLLTVRVALAHAALASATPASGSSVRHVPARVTARFSQEVAPMAASCLSRRPTAASLTLATAARIYTTPTVAHWP